MDRDTLLRLAAAAESRSEHPVARAVTESVKGGVLEELPQPESFESLTGRGIAARVEGRDLLIGSRRLMEEKGIPFAFSPESWEQQGKTVLFIAVDHEAAGAAAVADPVRKSSAPALKDLHRLGIRAKMVTGDNRRTAEAIAAQVGVDEVVAEVLPEGKVEAVEQEKQKGLTVAMAGDGINDAPVLARADIGIAMGGLGSDAAIEAADVVIMTDEPSRIATAMKISRKTLGIVKQNIVFALGVKILVLILAAIGMANMWLAVFADVGVAVLAILNAMRALQGIPCKQGKGID
uniref:heavy metal translocating P-type ATPase n=1 Tax=Eisenbergiella tayi TaxID=1432052 RepID=UPI003FED82D2